MKEESKKQSLKKALEQLPQHIAPEGIWMHLQADLERVYQQDSLQSALGKLPIHKAPEGIWSAIEADLPGANTRLFPRPFYRWAAAASIALVMGLGIWHMLTSSESAATIQMAYAEERISPQLVVQDWEEDEKGFQTVLAVYQEHQFLSEHPNYKTLNAELEELTNAKRALEEAIGNFNTQGHLIAELTDIELERTRILKAMIELI